MTNPKKAFGKIGRERRIEPARQPQSRGALGDGHLSGFCQLLRQFHFVHSFAGQQRTIDGLRGAIRLRRLRMFASAVFDLR